MTDILERNAKCPICGKFYHNIDINNNPVPSTKNKRPFDTLCQCKKGQDAREFRRIKRMELEEAREAKEARKADILSMQTRNRQFWEVKN